MNIEKKDNYAQKATDVGNVSLYSDTVLSEKERTDRMRSGERDDMSKQPLPVVTDRQVSI